MSAISHEHSWPVISAFFEKEGLVSQQLSSYNYFIRNMRKIVSDSAGLTMTPNKQYNQSKDAEPIVRSILPIIRRPLTRFLANKDAGFPYLTQQQYQKFDPKKQRLVFSDRQRDANVPFLLAFSKSTINRKQCRCLGAL